MTWQGVLAYLQALGAPAPSLFRYAIGQRVLWTDDAGARRQYVILQRRITESEVSEWTEYLLESVDLPTTALSWAYEPDCAEVPDAPR